jgi:AcrR family transcriptional regulator
MRQPKPTQARARRTRETLVQVAIQSLCDSHVHGLRFSQISKIAQVPQPLLDYHFPTMEALLGEMVSHQLDRLKTAGVAALEKNSKSPRKALTAYIRAPFELAAGDPGFRAVWSCYYHLATVNKAFKEFSREVRDGETRRIASTLEILIKYEKRQAPAKKKRVSDTATCIQGITAGFAYMAAADTSGEFKDMGDLAVKAALQIVDVNFPALI